MKVFSRAISQAFRRHRPPAVFLNAGRLNYDSRLDFTRLSTITQLTLTNVDAITNVDEIVAQVFDSKAEIVITKEMELPRSAIQHFPPSVRLICEAGTGYNNIALQSASERNIAVCNIPTYSNESVAHMVILYIMNFSAAIFDQARMLYSGNRANFRLFQHPIYEVNGKTLGLIGGSGRIGSAVMDLAIPLGMSILISSRRNALPRGHKYEMHPQVKVVSLEKLLQSSDFVSINCPLNKETRHSIGRNEIAKMKPTAFLINTARGAIINELELIQCMKENVISGAGLDTQEIEPPDPESDLWTLPNVFLTPHIGWRRIETRQRLVDMTADNIEAYINGTAINVVGI